MYHSFLDGTDGVVQALGPKHTNACRWRHRGTDLLADDRNGRISYLAPTPRQPGGGLAREQ